MIEFGKNLREAREQKGYSISQLAEMTHILPQIIESIEREDFTRIVAPIYGRGFIKLYCAAVGLEAQPFIDEFMAIYTGDRPPTIRLKEVPGKPAERILPAEDEVIPAPPPQAEPLHAEPAFHAEPAVQTEPAFQTEPAEESISEVEDPLPDPLADPLAEMAPKKRDYRLPGYSMHEVPRSFWRFGILIAVAILIVALLVIGTRALYRATMTVPPADDDAATVTEEVAAEPKQEKAPQREEPRAPRKGVKIPPLYID